MHLRLRGMQKSGLIKTDETTQREDCSQRKRKILLVSGEGGFLWKLPSPSSLLWVTSSGRHGTVAECNRGNCRKCPLV